MLERLIESWLDSASERSYQAPFCQMLAGEGHLVIHSTRHSPIEFGKDVISIGPDGVPCAFQLKGNPGGRLTLGQLRDIRPQLLELVTQPIVHPGVPDHAEHRCYLVTNGEADEEVHRSLGDLNTELERRGFGSGRIILWQRGRLIEMANRLGARLWPSEIDDLNTFLELLVHDGEDIFPFEKFDKLLDKTFSISTTETLGQEEANRRATSAAVMTAVALRTFSLKENHYATMCAWTMYAVYWIATCEKHNIMMDERRRACIDLAVVAIIDALANLCEDIQKNERLIGSGQNIRPIHRGRATLVVALMATYWSWSEKSSWPVDGHKQFLENWLPRDFSRHYLWGEAAIPQFLAHYWYLSRTDATQVPEALLGHLLASVVSGVKERHMLPSPYFTFEQVIEHFFGAFLKTRDDELADESMTHTSYFADALMHLYVRTNNKRSVSILWPEFTKIDLMHFDVQHAWQFPLWRSNEGQNVTRQSTLPKSWNELVDDARDCRTYKVPIELLTRHHLLLLFVIIFPHRGTPDVIRYLGREFGTVWFIPDPITNHTE